MDDEPGPLAVLATELYPKPGPGGELLGPAGDALGKWAGGAGPIAMQAGALHGAGKALGDSIGGLGAQMEPGMTYWQGQSTGQAVDKLAEVLSLPSPAAFLGPEAPIHPGPAPPAPDTSTYLNATDGQMTNLKDNLQNFLIEAITGLPQG